MSLKKNYELMADYNQWMNENIYSAASRLSTKELSEERGAFFGSMLGSLNHILVGDTIWLKRFAQHPTELRTLSSLRELSSPGSLDSILFTDFDELRAARIQMDEVIVEFSNELTDSVLDTALSYNNTKGLPFTKQFGYLVQHFFNHQTHHRGQISTLLNQVGIDVGVTDLLMRIPEN